MVVALKFRVCLKQEPTLQMLNPFQESPYRFLAGIRDCMIYRDSIPLFHPKP